MIDGKIESNISFTGSMSISKQYTIYNEIGTINIEGESYPYDGKELHNSMSYETHEIDLRAAIEQ